MAQGDIFAVGSNDELRVTSAGNIVSTGSLISATQGVLVGALINGGAAGDHTVTGIATGDVITQILYFAGAGSDVTNVSDLTGEFTISAANTINNTGGTSTAGGKIQVLYQDLT